MDSLSLPPIGWRHPRVRQVRHIAANLGAGRQRLFVAEGLWAHQILLDLGGSVELFLWCPESGQSDEARDIAAEIALRASAAFRVSEKTLERLCERERPDGMISLVPLPTWRSGEVGLGDAALVLVADAIEIPGNLGTLLRTVDACGADCLVMTNRRTRLAHPKVFRGSRGMNLRVPVLGFADPAEAQEWLRDNGFSTFLATISDEAVPYHDVTFGSRVAFVVGNERLGICPGWLDLGLPQITIPMHGRADSLNVAVSASVLLYAARAQRADPPGVRGEHAGRVSAQA